MYVRHCVITGYTKEEERMVLALIEVIVLEKETDTQAASYNALW